MRFIAEEVQLDAMDRAILHQLQQDGRLSNVDLARYLQRFHGEVLVHLPGVVRSNSMLVLRTVKRTTAPAF